MCAWRRVGCGSSACGEGHAATKEVMPYGADHDLEEMLRGELEELDNS
mgnify:CR=1 FL=1